eukprot:306644-Rhodomonas_salina.2
MEPRSAPQREIKCSKERFLHNLYQECACLYLISQRRVARWVPLTWTPRCSIPTNPPTAAPAKPDSTSDPRSVSGQRIASAYHCS